MKEMLRVDSEGRVVRRPGLTTAGTILAFRDWVMRTETERCAKVAYDRANMKPWMKSNSMIRRVATQDPGEAAAEIISLRDRLADAEKRATAAEEVVRAAREYTEKTSCSYIFISWERCPEIGDRSDGRGICQICSIKRARAKYDESQKG